jgi:hypothetical protein
MFILDYKDYCYSQYSDMSIIVFREISSHDPTVVSEPPLQRWYQSSVWWESDSSISYDLGEEVMCNSFMVTYIIIVLSPMSWPNLIRLSAWSNISNCFSYFLYSSQIHREQNLENMLMLWSLMSHFVELDTFLV